MKSKLLYIILLLVLYSCNNIDDTQYFPFKTNKDSKWGFIATNGDTLLVNTCVEKPSYAKYGRFYLINDSGYYDLYNVIGNSIVARDFEQICMFSDEVTPVIRKNSSYIELIDTNGTTLLKLKEIKGMKVVSCSNFTYGKAIVYFEDGSCGCINKEGHLVIEPSYQYLSKLSENIWLGVEKEYKDLNDKNLRFTFISSDGKVISHLKLNKYEQIDFADGFFMPVKTEDGWGIIDNKGNIVISPKYTYIKDITVINNNLKNFVYFDDNGWGVMDANENIIIDSQYGYLAKVDNNTLLAKDADSENCRLVDYSDIQIGSSQFKDYNLTFHGDGAFSFISEGCYGILTKRGDYLKNCPDIFEVDTDEGETFVSLLPTEDVIDNYDVPETLHIDNIPFTMIPVSNGDDSFYIQKTTVTQDLWTAIMGYNNSETMGNRIPVTNVSWYNCIEFVEKLSRKTGLPFSLPTEEEWFLAASCGENFNFSGSDDINQVGWYANNSNKQVHPVAQLHPNKFGLYDMTGNVWEWCWNICDHNQLAHSVRGGGWATSGNENLNIRHHDSYTANLGSKYHGFRLKLKTKTPLSKRELSEHCDSLLRKQVTTSN